MIDLHVHSTASDGRHDPAEVVRLAARAGLRVVALTDHDTTAGWPAARAAAEELGLELLAGIEVTAVHDGRDVHVLGYGMDPNGPELAGFLALQRQHRVTRARDIARRLRDLGMSIDVEQIIAAAPPGTARAVGRPAIAAALVAAGHVPDTRTAFDRWLVPGCPAFVPRTGASPAEVIGLIGRSGGLASLAHPVLLRNDALIDELVERGLGGLEVYHSEHGPDDVERYRRLARAHGLAATGGSDFHGEAARPAAVLGGVTLPPEDWDALQARLSIVSRP